jgi:2-(1,2-epoxy-1,2-dihydrophenyl)acetyl-CoA isomerase
VDSFTEIIVETAAAVTTITLNKPETLNALGRVNGSELLQALRAADDDDEVRCVVLTGRGRGFCVGADLKEMMASRNQLQAPRARAVAMAPLGNWNRILNVMRDFHKPIVAAINGLAVGGGLMLACAADIRIAADTAEFSAIFAKRGLAFEAGMNYYLPRLVGLEQAFRMVYTGDRYSAAEAARLGLVGEVVPSEELQSHTAAFAGRVAQMPTLQLAMARMELLKGLTFDDPNVSMMMEVFALGVAQRSHDYEEGTPRLSNGGSPDSSAVSAGGCQGHPAPATSTRRHSIRPCESCRDAWLEPGAVQAYRVWRSGPPSMQANAG